MKAEKLELLEQKKEKSFRKKERESKVPSCSVSKIVEINVVTFT